MAYDGSGRHPTLEALKKRAGLAEVIAGHVTTAFAFLWITSIAALVTGEGKDEG